VALLGAALVALAAALDAERGASASWARLGAFGAAASVAVAAALQAVDGVAFKVMVDRWASAAARFDDVGLFVFDTRAEAEASFCVTAETE
jgi:hypothetical protein